MRWNRIMKEKKPKTLSFLLSKYRFVIGLLATFLSNIHVLNFAKGTINQSKTKSFCVPGLNCYSCPAATGACPIGAFQAVVGSPEHNFSYYVSGLVILFGVTLARIVCGFLCPFGWFQELLYKIPSKKLSTKKVHKLTYLKYVILAVFVVLLPMFIVDEAGLSIPFFCKYLCPVGILEGAIPLAIVNSAIRASLGFLFSWKMTLLLAVILISVLIYRPFCKWICPLGAFYSLFNKISLVSLKVDKEKCISCGRCEQVCNMDVVVLENANDGECIRCGKCIKACPTCAISFSCQTARVLKTRASKNSEKKNEHKN